MRKSRKTMRKSKETMRKSRVGGLYFSGFLSFAVWRWNDLRGIFLFAHAKHHTHIKCVPLTRLIELIFFHIHAFIYWRARVSWSVSIILACLGMVFILPCTFNLLLPFSLVFLLPRLPFFVSPVFFFSPLVFHFLFFFLFSLPFSTIRAFHRSPHIFIWYSHYSGIPIQLLPNAACTTSTTSTTNQHSIVWHTAAVVRTLDSLSLRRHSVIQINFTCHISVAFSSGNMRCVDSRYIRLKLQS